jgi:hypothetical protein
LLLRRIIRKPAQENQSAMQLGRQCGTFQLDRRTFCLSTLLMRN